MKRKTPEIAGFVSVHKGLLCRVLLVMTLLL
jgi:hypothetical protein